MSESAYDMVKTVQELLKTVREAQHSLWMVDEELELLKYQLTKKELEA